MENLNNKIKKNIFHNETVLVSILIIVLTGALLIFSFKPVFALGSNNGAVQAGGGAELWNSSTNTFSPNVINDIKAKLFGTTNPVDYINSNYDAKEFSLSKSKVKSTCRPLIRISSSTIPSSTIVLPEPG